MRQGCRGQEATSRLLPADRHSLNSLALSGLQKQHLTRKSSKFGQQDCKPKVLNPPTHTDIASLKKREKEFKVKYILKGNILEYNRSPWANTKGKKPILYRLPSYQEGLAIHCIYRVLPCQLHSLAVSSRQGVLACWKDSTQNGISSLATVTHHSQLPRKVPGFDNCLTLLL